jgi:hypothetical protein
MNHNNEKAHVFCILPEGSCFSYLTCESVKAIGYKNEGKIFRCTPKFKKHRFL